MNYQKIFIPLFICLTIAFNACKKDLGNYTYHEVDVPVTEASSVKTAYDIEQNTDLTIDPEVKFNGNPENLSYRWIAYVKSLSSVTIGPPTQMGTSKMLKTKVVLPPGTYYLELVITDNSNQSVSTSRTILNVLAPIETGMLFMHTSNDETDVDFIASKSLTPTGVEKRLNNLLLATQGNKMPGTGQVIGFSRRSNSLFNWVTVGTSRQIKRVNGFTFALLGTDGQLFRRPTKIFNPQAHLNNFSNEFLVNDGRLQIISWGTPTDALYSGEFTGDYYLAPYIYSYSFYSFGALVYDQKNSRFLNTGNVITNLTFKTFKSITDPAKAFNPDNVGKDMLFMDHGFQDYAYAFFKDKTGIGRYLYVLNQSSTNEDNVPVAKYDMSALPEILDAKYYQVSDLGNIAYYATDKKVYTYEYSGTNNAAISFSQIGANETITGIKVFKPLLNGYASAADFVTSNNAVMYVATWDGTQGKVYELRVNPVNGAITQTPLNTYTGFGKITGMMTKFRGSGT